MTKLSKAAEDVLTERRRQIYGEGWTKAHDAAHPCGVLAAAGACYASAAADQLDVDRGYTDAVPSAWPWHSSWWKPGLPRRMLVKAAALLLAEIERGDRMGWPE